MTLLIKRGVYFIIEQPRSSVMWEHPAMKKFLSRWKSLIDTAENQIGAHNLENRKDTILKGWAPHLKSKRLNRKMTKQERAWMADGNTKATTVYWKEGATKRSRGTKHLKSTQSYPVSFGCSHALAFKDLDSEMDEPPHLVGTDTEDSDSADSCLNDVLNNDPEYFAGSASIAAGFVREQAVQAVRL